MSRYLLTVIVGLGILFSFGGRNARAEEGMWLLNELTEFNRQLREKYGLEVTPEVAEHIMHSAVRFPNGSGSFVSSDGYVLTNHHVALAALETISTKERNYVADGFLAQTPQEEIRLPNYELKQLRSIEDVTDRVQAALTPGMTTEQAHAARNEIIATITRENDAKTGNTSEVIKLFHGGQYHLYTFKSYTDVRLVFAPEFAIGFFGGDPDNYEFPRYSLDMTIMRVYENGQPAKPSHFLKWSTTGPADGDLILVAGHPGRTNRLYTAAAAEYVRDTELPLALLQNQHIERKLLEYAARGPEQKRQSKGQFFSVQNILKRYRGWEKDYRDEKWLAKKAELETELHQYVDGNEALKAKLPGVEAAWAKIAEAQKRKLALRSAYALLEGGEAVRTRLFNTARLLVRLADEDLKDDGLRLPAYQASQRGALKRSLLSEAPVYPEFEQFKLEDSLEQLLAERGPQDPLVVQILKGRTPKERASELVRGTSLLDLEVRRGFYEGGKAAIDASQDPMILLARELDPAARAIRKQYEAEVVEVEKQNYALIAQAQHMRFGNTLYPDATSSLRLSMGQVKGFTDERGQAISPFTGLGGAFSHEDAHGAQDPWKLPQSWTDAADRLDPHTTFNFVSTNDIVGGNSGSPAIRLSRTDPASACSAELVGLVFDSSAQALGGPNHYTGDGEGRAISVSSSGMVEALRKVYGADNLVRGLGW